MRRLRGEQVGSAGSLPRIGNQSRPAIVASSHLSVIVCIAVVTVGLLGVGAAVVRSSALRVDLNLKRNLRTAGYDEPTTRALTRRHPVRDRIIANRRTTHVVSFVGLGFDARAAQRTLVVLEELASSNIFVHFAPFPEGRKVSYLLQRHRAKDAVVVITPDVTPSWTDDHLASGRSSGITEITGTGTAISLIVLAGPGPPVPSDATEV